MVSSFDGHRCALLLRIGSHRRFFSLLLGRSHCYCTLVLLFCVNIANQFQSRNGCFFVNTVQFRFPVESPRSSWEEIARFLKQLDTVVLIMETAYRTAHDRSIFIRFTSAEAMNESLRKNVEPRMFQYTSGRSVTVRMAVAGSKYIRVFDLPPKIRDETLSLA